MKAKRQDVKQCVRLMYVLYRKINNVPNAA